ncbi:MAG: 2-succinyl-5-enolpyruvyl-6-hydroxy-3-cyclohexene-1-carboxylic-acid synthase [Thermaerobacter sp.]|nr:2-succinyl-5-enolpyruvyl-6-hydroxy-3-cyclohexene-1-carboxylic-acid synthase [Thermaerobacter sp.]
MDQYAALLDLCEQLLRSGLQDVVISPGSRSTPLALAFAAHPQIRRRVLLDERSAAFFALGLAKESGRPVAIVCTSGSAAANFHPAVVEARYGHVPLIVLTADRPRELRDVGASQTIDQVGLYGRDAKWFVDLPLGGTSAETAYARMVAARAVALSLLAPAGPVHINVPLREPLLPDAPLAERNDLPGGRLPPSMERRPPRDLLLEASRLLSKGRAVIVAGPLPPHRPAPDLHALAERTGLPLLLDPLSNLRFQGKGALDAYDLYLRDEDIRRVLQPDVVLRLGDLPTSKSLGALLSGAGEQILLSGEEAWRDPLLAPGIEVPGDAHLVVQELLELLPKTQAGGYSHAWQAADRAARRAAEHWLEGLGEPFDGAAICTLRELLGEDDLLYVGSSMPVRDLDGFGRGGAGPRVLANRGVNGIDGVVSSALGAAAAHRNGRSALAIGDLSFYHDQNGLLAAKRCGVNLAVLLLHNDGGGIFSFLPQAGMDAFEEFFGTPHGLDFAPVVQMYGGSYVRPRGAAELRSALEDALSAPGLNVVEVRTDRQRNLALHQEVFALGQEAARRALGDGQHA